MAAEVLLAVAVVLVVVDVVVLVVFSVSLSSRDDLRTLRVLDTMNWAELTYFYLNKGNTFICFLSETDTRS